MRTPRTRYEIGVEREVSNRFDTCSVTCWCSYSRVYIPYSYFPFSLWAIGLVLRHTKKTDTPYTSIDRLLVESRPYYADAPPTSAFYYCVPVLGTYCRKSTRNGGTRELLFVVSTVVVTSCTLLTTLHPLPARRTLNTAWGLSPQADRQTGAFLEVVCVATSIETQQQQRCNHYSGL